LSGGRPAAWILGVIVLSAVVIAVPAGRRPFWSSDEARYALLGQDVLDRGQWLVARLRDQPYLNKPQLFFWTVAVVSLPFGRVSEATAAIPPVIASLVGVIGVIMIGRLLWSWWTGVVAGLVLVTTPFHFEMSHQVLPDLMLNAWLVWALYWLLRAQRSGWPLGHLLAFYGCLTGGLLSKGPQALAALAAAGVAIAVTDGVAGVRRMRPLLGGALMLVAAAAVWLGPYSAASAGHFGDRVLVGHYLTWYLLGPMLSRLGALATPVLAFLPWMVFVVAAPLWWREAPSTDRRRLLAWTATLWLLAAVSGNARARYLLPVFPGLALLTAEFLTASVAGRALRALRVAAYSAAGVAIVTVAVITTPLAKRLAGPEHPYVPTGRWEQIAIAVLALGAASALIVAARRGAPGTGALGLALGMAGVLVIMGITYPVRYTRALDLRPMAAAVAANVPPSGTLLGYPDVRLAYNFYVRRNIIETRDATDVRTRVATAPPDAILVSADRWRALGLPDAAAWRMLASSRLGGRTFLLVGRPLP
jgi:4-amino-4-deoxy-L-arabinose transferase-like glycosyltransferase